MAPTSSSRHLVREGWNRAAQVMELVEGETRKGLLPVETVLNYTRQMAEAVETAQEKGLFIAI